MPCSPVQHLGGGPFQLLQDLQQLGVIVTQAAPAQHPRQVIAGPQGQDAQLALRERDGAGRGVSEQPPRALTTPPNPAVPIAHSTPGHTGVSQLQRVLALGTVPARGGDARRSRSLACGGQGCRSQRAPSPRCRPPRTPGSGRWRTSGRGAAWEGDRREGLGDVPGTHWDPAGATPGRPGQRLP